MPLDIAAARAPRPTWVAWGQLMRISLAPSAIGDAWLGLLLGAGTLPLRPAALIPIAASLCVYCGGLALNDLVDREEDRRTRPGRPVPSGAVPLWGAWVLALVLLLAGPAIAALASPGAALAYAAVALIAVLYDVAGRGPLRGPVLLGLARAGNVAAAAVAAGALFNPDRLNVPPAAWTLAACYGLYVFAVSRLGRLEDDPSTAPGARPRTPLRAAAVLLALGPLVAIGLAAVDSVPKPGFGEYVAAFAGALVAVFGARALWREANARTLWTHAEVVRAMGIALRRLMVFTGASALVVGAAVGAPREGAQTALLILIGFPLSARLRRRFPPS